ncbi:hypothetical protein TNCV_4637701 [Trichonephila clavipes]|nr:hypothetical protein TNCV_4637701 [Trichonephila clavipes]
MTNANIFKLDKLSFLNVTVEGYDSKGVTQCYKCQQFNHTASNCHIKPKCLKCGEPYQTSECEIDKVENYVLRELEANGHMANYSKCPLYPKPRKGATIKPNYTTIVNSLVRPNVSLRKQQPNRKIIRIPLPPPTDGTTNRSGSYYNNSTNSGRNNSHCKATKPVMLKTNVWVS